MTLTPDPGALLLPYRETARNGAPRLRVGVVLDPGPPSPWADELLAFLRKIPCFEVCALTLAVPGRAELQRPAWLMDRLYAASRARFDPLGDAALPAGEGAATPESVAAIRAAGCGAIVWLARCQHLEAEAGGLATHGVFTVRFGDGHRAIPFWDEVAGSRLTSTATVYWHDASLADGRAAATAEASTFQGLFLTFNAEQPLVGAIRLLAGLCLEIQTGGAGFERRLRALPVQRLPDPAPCHFPSNLEAARFAVGKLVRSAYLRWRTRGMQAHWFIAMRANRGGSITDPARMDLAGFQPIPLPPGVGAMADPFPWEAGGRQYLLFEEVPAGQTRGRLASVEVLPDGSCAGRQIVLERPYHLSYPCIVASGGELFLLPETSEARRIDLYRFRRFPGDVELVASPVEGTGLNDTTPVFVDGRWYFFTTTDPFMETVLFSAERLEGPWSLHPASPISTSVRSCRSAGHLFWRDGRLFRPTQDCSVRYGYAINVNEVTRLTPCEFEERPASHVPPSWAGGLIGTHTWNESSGWQAIDGLRMGAWPAVRPIRAMVY